MAQYEIEQNIPIPAANRGGRGRNLKYPFPNMGVGDSFFAPDCKTGAMARAAGYWRPKKFTCRKVDGGVRVWRTE